MTFYFEKDNRFYILELVVDLFGEVCIFKTWGSLRSKWERKAEIPIEKGKNPKDYILRLVEKRKARGYELIQKQESHLFS